MGEELARPAHAALHLVEDEEQPELVADRPQPLQIIGRGGAHAAFALHRLDEDRRGLVGDRGAHLVEIVESDVVEPVHRRPEALQVGLGPGRGERRKAAPVERPVAADHPVALGMAGLALVFARDLQ